MDIPVQFMARLPHKPHWIRHANGELCLVEVRGRNWNEQQKILRTSKFEQPKETLFLEFAALAPSEQSILEFAQKHGFLGIPERLNPKTLKEGEFLYDWLLELWDMKYAVRVWEACKDREAPNIDTLQSLFTWNTKSSHPRGTAMILFHSHSLEVFNEQNVPPECKIALLGNENTAHHWDLQGKPIKLENHDYVKAAYLYLGQEIRAHLETGDEPSRRLEKNKTTLLPSTSPQVYLDLTWNPHLEQHESILKVRTLLGLMWSQLQETINNRIPFKRCQRCGRWFKSKKERGTKAKWCTDSCKVSFCRERARQQK
jgi:hypothetical protein